MLEIAPLSGEEAAAFIKQDNSRDDRLRPGSIVLLAREGGMVSGFAALSGDSGRLAITAFSHDDDITGEFLLRAAASFAERRGIATVTATIDDPLLERVGFENDGENLALDVSKIVHYSQKSGDFSR